MEVPDKEACTSHLRIYKDILDATADDSLGVDEKLHHD